MPLARPRFLHDMAFFESKRDRGSPIAFGLAATGLWLAATIVVLFSAPAALADKIKNPTAIFAGLDKITGRIISFEVSIDETVQFGSLQLTARVCYSRPEYENPRTTTFVEVEEVSVNNEYKRVFTGWMFAASPGLSAIEHPVYDLWLTECKGGTEIIKTPTEDEEEVTPPPQTDASLRRAPAEPAKTPPRPKLATDAQRREPSQSFFPTTTGSGRGAPLRIGPDLFRSN